jgi:ribosomal protein L40E
MADIQEKSMVPTVLVGIGGTGHEVLARIRRLIEETYGSLKNFPIVSFLIIDTDKEYKITNPKAAGSPFKDHEKFHASVSGRQVTDIMSNMGNYPWIESWFPTELERNLSAIEAGAGQIRGCGRFAFFYNYHKIQAAFKQACDRIKGHENFMLDRYGIKVITTGLNAFITGSLSGGTGSGMLIDIGYSIRHWLKGEASPNVTAIVPMPSAFAGINVGDRVLANGYAAMMELSYFSDYRTEYLAQYSSSLMDEIKENRAPFDFTYLVGTKNGDREFTLDEIREMIAQNIFLDLTSDFAPHKRSIRDNIKGAWAQADPGGRGFPKNFMSFGLSSVEIPVVLMRTSLSNQLAADFVNWWRNPDVALPPQMQELVENNILKEMGIRNSELLANLSAADDRPYASVISSWVSEIRQEIATDSLLQCTQQGVNIVGSEKGKILRFVKGYLTPKVDEYYRNNFSDFGPDERTHGAFLRKMYDNRNQIIQRGREALEAELYSILEDRNRGPKFANDFLNQVELILTASEQQFRTQIDNIWLKNKENSQNQYQNALQDIDFKKDKFDISKQARIEEYCDKALKGLEGWLISEIQAKSRSLGLTVIARLKEHLQELKRRFYRLMQKLVQYQDYFQQQAEMQANNAEALLINGIKLYERQELTDLYRDLLEQLAGTTQGSKSRYEIGLDGVCSNLSRQILEQTSLLWTANRGSNQTMKLFDLTQLEDVQDDDVKSIIANKTTEVITTAPDRSKLKNDLDACTRIFKFFDNDPAEIRSQIGIAYNKSKPLILLSRSVMTGKDAGFTEALNQKAALVGGKNPSDPAAQKLLPFLEERVGKGDAITPLGEAERHRVVFVQETGGFSLRCIEGMQDLRQSYQDWKGQTIEAKRAQLRGESKDPPIPVHIQKEPPFWDVFPENPAISALVVQARALEVLRLELNRSTKEHTIRYTIATVTDLENVDIASSWEEATQVLEVKACRPDKEEIERQVKFKLTQAETDQEKNVLYQQLIGYLKQREQELAKEGGKDSLIYKRENKIIQDVIITYKLLPQSGQDLGQVEQKPVVVQQELVLPNNNIVDEIIDRKPDIPVINETQPDFVFCISCGTKNPVNSNFCFKCGTPLVKPH